MQENIIIEELHEDGTVMTPMSEFSAPLQRRILYLKELQKEFEGQEDELNKEMKALEQKYAEIYGMLKALSFLSGPFLIGIICAHTFPAACSMLGKVPDLCP